MDLSSYLMFPLYLRHRARVQTGTYHVMAQHSCPVTFSFIIILLLTAAFNTFRVTPCSCCCSCILRQYDLQGHHRGSTCRSTAWCILWQYDLEGHHRGSTYRSYCLVTWRAHQVILYYHICILWCRVAPKIPKVLLFVYYIISFIINIVISYLVVVVCIKYDFNSKVEFIHDI